MKRIPKFQSEDRERKFWAAKDSTAYIDWSQAKRRKLPNLRRPERLAQERARS